jgi:hypothetical protein
MWIMWVYNKLIRLDLVNACKKNRFHLSSFYFDHGIVITSMVDIM